MFLLKTGSTNSYKKSHELYHKFDEDHEYVVLLNVEWIFTKLLTEMRKPEVEKKRIIENLTSELCWGNSNCQYSLKYFHTVATDNYLEICKVTKTDSFWQLKVWKSHLALEKEISK